MKKIIKFRLLIVFILLVSACSNHNKYYSGGSGAVAGEKVSLKGADASSLTLANGLRAIIISSPSRADAAISVAVNVGSFSDPAQHIGMAHYVEHLLFLGTKEYPQADGLLDFVNSRGGGSNADTASSRTRYYLSIDPANFEEATSRLSRFFVSPLFQETFTDKEKNAINNEFLLRYDGVAQYRAMTAIYLPGESGRKFNVGNSETLKNTTAADAREFFEKYYSANKMAIVITGPQSLEVLTGLVKKYFSDVPVRSGIADKEQDAQINTGHLNEVVRINNPKYDSNINFSVILPDEFKDLPDAFGTFLSRLLGNEGPGSLLAVLQDKGWAVPKGGAISAYISGNELTFSIDLTPEGVAHYKEVILFAKGEIEFLRGQNFPGYIQDEAFGLEKASAIEKNYSSIGLNEVAYYSALYLETENWKDVFGQKQSDPFDASVYTNFLSKISFDKVYGILIDGGTPTTLSYEKIAKDAALSDPDRLDFVSTGGKSYLLDGYTKLAYEIETLNLAGQPAAGSGDFLLPAKNGFIPLEFETYPTTGVAPKVSTANTEVFLNPGAGVTSPKAYFRGLFFSPQTTKANKKKFIQMVMMKNWVLSSIKEEIYPLIEAEFSMELTVSRNYKALEINCSGWSSSFEKSVTEAISQLNFNEDELAFARFKQVALVSLRQQLNDPETLLGTQISANYVDESPSVQEQYTITENITLSDLKATYHEVFDHFYFQGVVSGNVKTSFAESAANAIESKFQPKSVPLDQVAALKQPNYTTVTNQTVIEINVTDSQNAYVDNFYNFGTESKKEKIITQMIGNWISGDFFNELRTQQQIAYSLSADYGVQGQYYGLSMYVQSGTNSSEDVYARMEAFLHKWVSETLATKNQNDVDLFIKRTKESDEISKNGSIDTYRALGKYLGLEPVYNDEADAYRITIAEVKSLAMEKLIDNPNGLFIKVRSDKDSPSHSAPVLGVR